MRQRLKECVWFTVDSILEKHPRAGHLEALWLLPDLHDVLAPQFPLPPLVVLQLVGELRLVLSAYQLLPCLLDASQVPELQLLHGLMVSEQHGVLQVLLRLPFVQLLDREEEGREERNQAGEEARRAGPSIYVSTGLQLSNRFSPSLPSKPCSSVCRSLQKNNVRFMDLY